MAVTHMARSIPKGMRAMRAPAFLFVPICLMVIEPAQAQVAGTPYESSGGSTLFYGIVILAIGLVVYLAYRSRKADAAKGVELPDARDEILRGVGWVLLVGGIIAVILFIQINPVIQTDGVATFHPEVASRQQTLLIVSGVSALIGAIITFRKRT